MVTIHRFRFPDEQTARTVLTGHSPHQVQVVHLGVFYGPDEEPLPGWHVNVTSAVPLEHAARWKIKPDAPCVKFFGED